MIAILGFKPSLYNGQRKACPRVLRFVVIQPYAGLLFRLNQMLYYALCLSYHTTPTQKLVTLDHYKAWPQGKK